MTAPGLLEMMLESEDFQRQLRKVTEAFHRIDWPALQQAIDALEGYDEHHPRPLPIDGPAYARRRRSRRTR